MSKSAFTIKAFAVYLLILGITILLAPNLLLSVFGMPATSEVWIRVVGLLVINIGVYYWYAAKSEAKPFFMASVFTRIFVLAAFTALVVLGFAEPVLIFFGAVDFAGGIWTCLVLRGEQARQPSVQPSAAT